MSEKPEDQNQGNEESKQTEAPPTNYGVPAWGEHTPRYDDQSGHLPRPWERKPSGGHTR